MEVREMDKDTFKMGDRSHSCDRRICLDLEQGDSRFATYLWNAARDLFDRAKQ